MASFLDAVFDDLSVFGELGTLVVAIDGAVIGIDTRSILSFGH